MLSFSAASALHRFKESVQTLGRVDPMGRVHCVSPLLYETGRIPFTLSMDNGRSFPRSGSWLAGEPHFAAPGLGTKLHAPQALVAPWGLPQCESVRTWPAHWVPPLWLNQSFGRPAQPRGLGSCSSCLLYTSDAADEERLV